MNTDIHFLIALNVLFYRPRSFVGLFISLNWRSAWEKYIAHNTKTKQFTGHGIYHSLCANNTS